MLARNRPDIKHPLIQNRRESDVSNKLEAAIDRRGAGWSHRHRCAQGRCRLLLGRPPPGVLGVIAVLLYAMLLYVLLLALLREPLR